MTARQLELIFEFERYLLEHPQLAEQIPDEAVLCFQVKGDEAFNAWSRQVAQERAEKERKPMVCVAIQRLRPIRSRIERVELAHSI
jgi:hypothetical protein